MTINVTALAMDALTVLALAEEALTGRVMALAMEALAGKALAEEAMAELLMLPAELSAMSRLTVLRMTVDG